MIHHYYYCNMQGLFKVVLLPLLVSICLPHLYPPLDTHTPAHKDWFSSSTYVVVPTLEFVLVLSVILALKNVYFSLVGKSRNTPCTCTCCMHVPSFCRYLYTCVRIYMYHMLCITYTVTERAVIVNVVVGCIFRQPQVGRVCGYL